MGKSTHRTTHGKIVTVREWPLPKPQNKIKSFVRSCSFYGKFIHHFFYCVAPLANVCLKNLHGNVVYTKAPKVAFETLKSCNLYASVLLIPKAIHDA